MARTTSLAVFVLGLCMSRLAIADEPAAIPPATTEQIHQTVERAIPWLEKESAAWLSSRGCAACPRESMQTTIDELFALQRADGGWSQTVPELRSDAFATGQTLYVLSLAGFTAERSEIKRGIDFLVATQEPDGSWPMISRSTPDGSPGSSKLLTPITCAATSCT